MNLPNPQISIDAQSGIITYAHAVSKSAIHLLNSTDKTNDEYSKLHAYFKDNVSKLLETVNRVDADLA